MRHPSFLLLESVDPVGFQIKPQKDNGTQRPGQRICPEYHFDTGDEADDNGDIGDSDETPAGQHDIHGHCRFSAASHQSCNAVRKGSQEKEGHDGPGLAGAVINDLRIPVEGCYQLRDRCVDDEADQLCCDQTAKDAEAGSFFCPIVFSGAQVLADKSSQRHGETGDRKKGEAFDPAVSAAACHCHFSKGIDVGLDKYIGNGNDGILQSGWQTVGDDLAQHEGIQTDLFQGYTVFIRTFAGQAVQAQQGTEKLGNNSSQCSGAYAEVKDAYKEQIQDDIYQRGKYQVIKRMAAVSHRLENPYKIIVQYKGEGSQKINAEIHHRAGEHFLRCFHQLQDQRCAEKACHRQNKTTENAESYGGMDAALQLLSLTCPIIPGNDYTCADGDPIEKAHQQKDQTAGGADCSQGIATEKIAHDQCICCVVKLLKQIAQKQRKRKGKHALPDRAFCQQIFCL